MTLEREKNKEALWATLEKALVRTASIDQPVATLITKSFQHIFKNSPLVQIEENTIQEQVEVIFPLSIAKGAYPEKGKISFLKRSAILAQTPNASIDLDNWETCEAELAEEDITSSITFTSPGENELKFSLVRTGASITLELEYKNQ